MSFLQKKFRYAPCPQSLASETWHATATYLKSWQETSFSFTLGDKGDVGSWVFNQPSMVFTFSPVKASSFQDSCQGNTSHFIHNNPKLMLGCKTPEKILAFTKDSWQVTPLLCWDSSSSFMKKSVLMERCCPKHTSWGRQPPEAFLKGKAEEDLRARFGFSSFLGLMS